MYFLLIMFTGSLDVTLVGWLLLFLSKCLDSVTSSTLVEVMASKHSKEFTVQNRLVVTYYIVKKLFF